MEEERWSFFFSILSYLSGYLRFGYLSLMTFFSHHWNRPSFPSVLCLEKGSERAVDEFSRARVVRRSPSLRPSTSLLILNAILLPLSNFPCPHSTRNGQTSSRTSFCCISSGRGCGWLGGDTCVRGESYVLPFTSSLA